MNKVVTESESKSVTAHGIFNNNTSGEIVGCPIIRNSTSGTLHIWMATEENEGYIQCEKLALLDMSFRGYKKVDSLPISEMINVSDAIQGIFEYI